MASLFSIFIVATRSAASKLNPRPTPAGLQNEIIDLVPTAWVRRLPVTEVEVLLTAHEGDEERPIASYTLFHGGFLHRR
jgi:hypothetical protein